jgi:hypothetical protein
MVTNISKSVIERILISKSLLQPLRFNINVRPTNILLFKHILTSHDAAELAIAAVATHLGCLPSRKPFYLMDYFAPIEVKYSNFPGKSYFSQLNTVRNNVKHEGIFPNADQWIRTVETTYDLISQWCEKFFDKPLNEFNESDLIIDEKIKALFDSAQKSYEEGNYKDVFEKLAVGEFILFKRTTNLRGLSVNTANANDAIKLSAYGVNPNEYLQFQEFMPTISANEKKFEIEWKQEEHGHPGNWREDTTEFCLRAFLSIVISIQDIEWIPGSVHFSEVYEYEITALKEGVILSGEEMINNKWQAVEKKLDKDGKSY